MTDDAGEMSEIGSSELGISPVRITAATALDIWAFGVVLFELLSGHDLFHKNVRDDTIATPAKCEALANWTDPPLNKLELILRDEGISPALVLAAQDLVSACLQGDPQARPSSMAAISEHPFFILMLQNNPDPKRGFPTPVALPVSRGGVDVIFSYTTRDIRHLWRLKRALRTLGITTSDGTEVPPGCDWRELSFQQLESAKVFVCVYTPKVNALPSLVLHGMQLKAYT